MKPHSLFRFVVCAAAISAAPGILLSPSHCRAAEVVVEEEGAEVLTRGPIHEAFAETVVFKPTQGIMVSNAPPAAVEELPPDQRPEGANITWIPGYWAWEDDASEFLWVSGIWRNLPPGRQWVPGYWQEMNAEHQWISGYWADAEVEEVEYLPEPPASIEAGPNVERPSDDQMWIPGSWSWHDTRYRWRPGYWDEARPDWMWVPAHYVSTHRGYVFVDGYWDYPVARRGMIFAPVRFHAGHYSRPDYYYRPSVVISLALFTDHLFLRPRSRHYYFGDYYDARYRRSGYYASHTYYSGRHGYDPIYAHQRWMHRDDDRWERRREENFRYLRDNRDERPPQTLAALAQFAGRTEGTRRFDPSFARPLTQVVSSTDAPVKFKQVDEAERQQFRGRGREIREFGEQRKQLAKQAVEADEKAPPPGAKSGKRGEGKELTVKEPKREKFRRSPVVARTTDTPGQDAPPPKRPQVTVPDDPKARTDPKATDQPPRGPKGKNVPGKTDNTPPADPPLPDVQRPKTEPPLPDVQRPKTEPPLPDVQRPKTEPPLPDVQRPKTEPGDAPSRNPKTNPKETPKADPKEKPNTDPKSDPPETPRRGPKGRRDGPSTSEPKVAPLPEPKVDPKVAPPLPEPKVDPKVAPPMPEPRVPRGKTPRVEPKESPPPTAPKVEPEPKPAPAPKAEPRSEPKSPSKPREPKAVPSQPRQQKVEPTAPVEATAPRSEPKVAPRREPKTAAPARPQPQPKAQPESRKNPKKTEERKKG